MDTASQIQETINQFGGIMLIFLPVLFGAVEFIKEKLGFKGRTVELLAMALFVLFGVLVVVTFYYPDSGTQAAAMVVFLLMCALAPSGYYKFINSRAPRKLAARITATHDRDRSANLAKKAGDNDG